MKDRIHVKNICPCSEDKCNKRWYSIIEDKWQKWCHDITLYWYRYHCNEPDCHTIFDDGDDNGFLCYECGKPACDKCIKYDDDFACCSNCRRVSSSDSIDISLGSEDTGEESFDGWLFK